MNFSDDELDRYARQLVLPAFGGLGQQRLKAARVALIGAGGIGSAVIPALAGVGIGALTIVDSDRVERANLHRQPLYKSSQVGMGKALLAAQFVMHRNPHVAVVEVAERIGMGNAAEILAGHDLVIDGSDNFATRLAVSDSCVALGIPLLSAAAVQFQGQVGLWRGKPCYRCFVGDAFDAEDCDNCAELGVLGAFVATVGSYAALVAVNALAGIGPDPAGTLHLFDGEALAWRHIRMVADKGCQACGSEDAADR